MITFTEYYRLLHFARQADGNFSYLWYGQRYTVTVPVDLWLSERAQ
jgi:hypothetical protein